MYKFCDMLSYDLPVDVVFQDVVTAVSATCVGSRTLSLMVIVGHRRKHPVTRSIAVLVVSVIVSGHDDVFPRGIVPSLSVSWDVCVSG